MYNNGKILAAVCILLCALLPFIHDIITDVGGNVKEWVPDMGIQRLLKDPETGKVLGYSSYRVMLGLVGIQLFALIGWAIALIVSKGKPWRRALLFPVFIMAYQVVFVMLDLRKTSLNNWNYKIFLLIIIGFILIIFSFLRSEYTSKRIKEEN